MTSCLQFVILLCFQCNITQTKGQIIQKSKEKQLQELVSFLRKAILATYAGGGPENVSEESGFTEHDFSEKGWSYKDSYMGFFQSWGRETVWLNGKLFWNQSYGGGMTGGFQRNAKFAEETFDFLKKALSAGKNNKFRPRGPKEFSANGWKYICRWQGDVCSFSGYERIIFQGRIVFKHNFFGGLVL